MPAFKWFILKGQTTFPTVRCPLVISMRQLKKKKKKIYSTMLPMVTQSAPLHEAKRWITAQKTHQHSFPVAVYLRDKF